MLIIGFSDGGLGGINDGVDNFLVAEWEGEVLKKVGKIEQELEI